MNEEVKAALKGIDSKKYKRNKKLPFAKKLKLKDAWEVIYALNLKEESEDD